MKVIPMKVSQYLRQWQITEKVPDEGSAELAFIAGWLVGTARQGLTTNHDQAREMAIKIAEFIENQK